MAVYRKKQPARRPVRRGWKRHARTGMFLFAFALVAVTVGVILPHAGVMSAAAEGSTLTEKIFTTVQNKNLPVIAIDPGHGGTDPGSEGSGLWEYEMTWQVANELVNLLEQDGRYAPVLTITEEESQNSDMPRVEPAERAQRANDAGAVLLFSIHGNSDPSGTASGFECYAIPPGQQYHDESVALGPPDRPEDHPDRPALGAGRMVCGTFILIHTITAWCMNPATRPRAMNLPSAFWRTPTARRCW